MQERLHEYRSYLPPTSFNALILEAMEIIMVAQADIDARTAAIAADVTNLNAALVGVQAKFDAAAASLAAANPAIDLTALDAAIKSLDDVTAKVGTAAAPAPVAAPVAAAPTV